MSSENWKLERDLCRCCHSEGSFKNLAEPFQITVLSDLVEVYADMLKECYGIDMAPVPGLLSAMTYTICEVCIMRLRDAAYFKKQVLSCEERFKDMYNKNDIKAVTSVEVEIKEEILTHSDPSEPDEDFKEDLPLDDNDDEAYDESMDTKINEEADEKSLQVEVRKKRKYKPRMAKSAAVNSAAEKSVAEKSKAVKTKKKTKRNNLKKEPADTENDAESKQGRVVAPKFRLNDEDYKKIGDIYQCARCDKTYEKVNTLKFHVKTKHYKIPRYKCSICLTEFMTPAPLTVHKLQVHNVDDRFNCRACNKIFNTKVQLRKHINNFHMLGERYKCEFCDYESFSFEGMYKHKFKHKTVKDYHCKFCRKSFLRKTTLDLHERIHTGDRRKVCTVCGQAFVQKASLNYHMTKYHPEVNF